MRDVTGVGERCRALRQLRGLKIVEVARHMGADPSNVSDFERGVYNPTMSTVVRYCKAIGAHIKIELEEGQ